MSTDSTTRIATWLLEAEDEVTARDAAVSLDHPHVIHVFDELLKSVNVIGPFPGPTTAAVFADRYVREVGEGLCVSVLPLEFPDLS